MGVMISRGVIKAFLERSLNDYSWLKRQPKRRILRRIMESCARKHLFKTPPYKHQVICFYIGTCLDRFLFLLDMGLGKTKIVLDLFEYHWNAGNATKALVLVPNRVNVDGWEEEIDLHSRLPYQPLLGSTEEKWRLLEEPADIYVTHYAGFVHMVSKRRKKKTKKGKAMQVDEKKIARLADQFDFVVLDEVHKLKNHNSLIYKCLLKLSPLVGFVYGMTGTPFGKNPENLWPEFHVVDLGETLGDTLGLFREAFFDEKFGYGGHRKYVLKKGMEEQLHQVIQNRSIRYEDHECTDVPQVVRVKVPVTLSDEAAAYYKPTHQTLIESMRKDKKATENNYTQLREICSGFLMWKDEGTKNKVIFKENPKIEAIEELALELPASRKMVIFHEFIDSGRAIAAKLRELGLDCAEVRGEIKDTSAEVRKFKTKDSCRFLVANIASGAEGGNYQIANTLVFFESPSDPIRRTQAEKRVSGARQKKYKRVYMYDLATKGTVEDDILESLKEGEDLFESLVNGKAIVSAPEEHRYAA